MFNVKFKYTKGEKRKRYVIINGIEDRDAVISGRNITLIKQEAINLIKCISFYDLTLVLDTVKFNIFLKKEDYELTISKPSLFSFKNFSELTDSSGYTLSVTIKPQLNAWNKPWSFINLINVMMRVASLNYSTLKIEKDILFEFTPGIVITFTVDQYDIVGSAIDNFINLLEHLFYESNEILIKCINKESLVTYFSFPPEIKNACSQYLIFFSEFLADQGINVKSELKEVGDQIFFKVTPENKEDALYKIHELLEKYLKVNLNEPIVETVTNNSFLLKLKIQINNFKSLLKFTNPKLDFSYGEKQEFPCTNHI